LQRRQRAFSAGRESVPPPARRQARKAREECGGVDQQHDWLDASLQAFIEGLEALFKPSGGLFIGIHPEAHRLSRSNVPSRII